MGIMKTMAATVAMSALAAACSGGGSESSEPASTLAAEVEQDVSAADATAAMADAAPTAGDDVTTLDGLEYASLTGDAAAGKMVFAQCRTCHVTDPGVNRIGPSLAGIVGRQSGSVPGFKYSQANANSGITWTEENLSQYLANPQQMIPKTKMIFAGIPDAQKRADLIAYLKNPS